MFTLARQWAWFISIKSG